MSNAKLSELSALLESLPSELQQEVFDFASYLAERNVGGRATIPNPRLPGLQTGKVTTTSDFDDALPDTFWLGQEA